MSIAALVVAITALLLCLGAIFLIFLLISCIQEIEKKNKIMTEDLQELTSQYQELLLTVDHQGHELRCMLKEQESHFRQAIGRKPGGR